MGKSKKQKAIEKREAKQAAQAAEDVKKALQDVEGKKLEQGTHVRHVEGGQRLFNRLLTSNDKKHGGLEEHEVEFCQKAFETPTNDTILSALKTIQKCLQLMSETRSALGSGVLEAEEEEEMEDVDDEDPDMEGYEGLWGPDLESDEEIDV